MSGETSVNRFVAETCLNPVLQAGTTELNPVIHRRTQLPAGTVLGAGYEIQSRLDVTTGEADLYRCVLDGVSFVAKRYRRPLALKAEVAEKLREISSPHVASILETGTFEGLPYEILPCYEGGSLQGRTFSAEELKTRLIPDLNEGLRAIHESGILHKDLKPSNILLDRDGAAAIIDFGISSVREDGATVVHTQTGMTPEYAAPETFRGLFLRESDYYALGVTIFELYYGHSPYTAMTQEEIERYLAVQRLPFPEDREIPQELRELITALTYYDITGRHQKENPNRRWGYEEVKAWCEGVRQTIPGEGVDRRDMEPYLFLGKAYESVAELVRALAEHWATGRRELYRGRLSAHFERCIPYLGVVCREAEEEAAREPDSDDRIFWRTLRRLDPGNRDIFWKGRFYAGLPALGRELLDGLWVQNEDLREWAEDVLRAGILSEYLSQSEHKREAVEALEAASRLEWRESLLWQLGYLLSGRRILRTEMGEFSDLDTFTEELNARLNRSFAEFQRLCHRLLPERDRLDPQFEGWLIAQGKGPEVRAWLERMNQ